MKVKTAALCAGALLWSAVARAEDRVLLLDSEVQPRPELAAALQIQLTGAAAVSLRHELPAADVAARIRHATELSQEESVVLVVWADGPSPLAGGGQEAVLYAVGRRQGRALLEVVRVPGGSGPDMDRTLALKVSELVSAVQRAEPEAEAAALESAALVPATAAAPSQPGPATPEREAGAGEDAASTDGWQPSLGAGLIYGTLERSEFGQWGVQGYAGLGLRTDAFRLAARLGLAFFPHATVQSDGGRASIRELAPELTVLGQWQQQRFWLGLRAGLAWSFIAADGRTALGAPGSDVANVPAVRAGVDLEADLGSSLGLALAIELEARLVRQRFTVNESVELTDLGLLRPLLRLSLVFSP